MPEARATPIVYQGQQPSSAPFPKVVYSGIISAFGNSIYGIRRASFVAQAGTTDQAIISPNGTCASGLATPQSFILGFGTQQAIDSYNLPILGGPSEPEPGNIFTQSVGTSATRVILGFKTTKGKGGRKLPWQTRTYAGLGIKGGNGPTGVGLPPAYGTFPIPDPNNSGSYISPAGTADKIVNAPEIEVEIATVGGIPQGLQFDGDSTNGLAVFIDQTSVQFDSLGRLHVASLPGAAGAALGLYKSGFGIQINGTLPPVGVTAAAIAGSGLGIGLYDYVATKRTLTGKESGPSAPIAMTTTTGNQEGSVVLPALDATADPLSIGYSLYRSPVGGAGTPIAQCGGVTASVDGSGKTVYQWTGSGCTLTYDASILAQPGSAGPPATPPLPIDPATGIPCVFVAGTCSFTSGGGAFDQTLPQTYPSGQGYHWIADMDAGTYLDTASDASISGNKRPPTDNTPEIDTLLATFDDTQDSPLHAGLINNAHSGAVLPLDRGLSANPDWVTIEINPINQLEVIGSAAAGQPCVEGNPCPVPSGGQTPGNSYGPGSTANGNNPGTPGSAPPGTTGGATGLPAPGQNCSGGATAYYTPTYYQFAQFGTVRNIWTGTNSVELNIDPPNDGGNCHADIGFFSTATGYDQFFLCEAVVTSIGTGSAQIGGNFVQGGGPNNGSGSSTGANDGWAYTTADGWTCQRVGSNVFTPSIQPGPTALLGLYIDCNGVMHYYIAPYDGNLTEVYKSTGTVAAFSMSGATPPTGQGWGGSMGFAPSGGGVSAREVGQINGIKAGHGLPGDLTINNFNGSGLPANSGTIPPCPSTINPADCTQWAQGYADFLANTAATAPPTCPYGPNPFSDQCKAYDMGWWDGYNTFHASAPNTGQGSNSPSNTSTSPTPTTPGAVPPADSTYWQAGYAAHQAGGSNTCPYTDATQCLYWTQGWQAATGSGTSSTTTNAPVPGTVPGGNATDYQAGYNAYINGLPITCPGGDTATQCQYYQQGWTDAASVTTTSGSTTGSPGTGGTVAQGGGTIGGGGGTTGGTTLLTPPSGDICTGTAGAYPGSLGAMSGYQVGGYLCYEPGTGFYWFNDGTGQSGDFQYVSGTWSQVGGGAWGTYSPNGLPFGSKYSGIVGGAGSTGSGSTGTVSGAGGGSSSGIIQSGDVFVQGNESITGNLEVQSNETVLGTLLAKAGLVAQGPISSTGAVSGLSFQGTKVALTYAATISLNPALGDLFTTTTTNAVGNATINAASAGLAGQRIYVQITNDATAPRTITFGTNLSSVGTLVGTISKTAVILFESDGTTWFEVGRSTSGIPSTYTLPDATTTTIGGVEVDVVPASGHATAITYGPAPSGDTSGATDTTNLQAALTAIPSSGGVLRLRPGTYYITALTVPHPTTLLGTGSQDDSFFSAITKIICTSATANAITVAVPPFTMQGIALVNGAGSTPTAGSGLLFSAANSGLSARILDCMVHGFYVGVDMEDGVNWHMQRCDFFDNVHYALLIRNTSNPDGGDMGVEQCNFYAGPNNLTPPALIRYESGGGLRFIGNKLNNDVTGAAVVGLDLAIADGAATSDLLCLGNSIENVGTGIRVHLKGPSNTGTFHNVVLVGNEIAPTGSGTGIAITPEATGAISAVIIDDNAIAAAATGVSLANVDNVALGLGVFTGVTTPLTVGANVTNLVQAGTGTGTVTSVGLTAPAFLTVGGSPVTGSGTLALTLATEIENTVFAGPPSGVDAAPTFRGLVQADVPDLSSLYQPVGSTGTGTDHLHGLARWVAAGGTTFELPDLAEYVEMVYDSGSAVDGSTVTLSADRSQLVFDVAPTAGHVLQAEYVVARI